MRPYVYAPQVNRIWPGSLKASVGLCWKGYGPEWRLEQGAEVSAHDSHNLYHLIV
jgi:hypothetical protein